MSFDEGVRLFGRTRIVNCLQRQGNLDQFLAVGHWFPLFVGRYLALSSETQLAQLGWPIGIPLFFKLLSEILHRAFFLIGQFHIV